MLLQVHDELVLEVPAKSSPGSPDWSRRRWKAPTSSQAPLKVDMEAGPNWLEMR